MQPFADVRFDADIVGKEPGADGEMYLRICLLALDARKNVPVQPVDSAPAGQGVQRLDGDEPLGVHIANPLPAHSEFVPMLEYAA